MFVKRNIQLAGGESLINSVLINAEDLNECLTAKNIRNDAKRKALAVIEKAKRHAAEIIRQSRQEAQELVEEDRQRAYREVWDSVNQHLQMWQRQQADMWDAIEGQAERVVNKALESICLRVEEPERIRILLKHIIAAQKTPLKAVLRCPAEQVNEVSRQIESKAIEYWTLKPDPSLPPDSLVVESGQGTFSISWPGLMQSI